MDMSGTDIRIELLRSGVKIIHIARAAGVSHSMVSQVIDGKKISERVQQAIAESIGMDVKRIWPSRYVHR